MTGHSLAHRAVVGVDTHKDLHVAAAVDELGRLLGFRTVRATEHGYGALHGWAIGLAEHVRFGIEGTGSWGAGLSRHLEAKGCDVVEIRGPNRKARRDRGKSDTVDAECAARAVLAGTATVRPKAGNDWLSNYASFAWRAAQAFKRGPKWSIRCVPWSWARRPSSRTVSSNYRAWS